MSDVDLSDLSTEDLAVPELVDTAEPAAAPAAEGRAPIARWYAVQVSLLEAKGQLRFSPISQAV